MSSHSYVGVAETPERSEASGWPSARLVYLVALVIATVVSLLYLSQTSDLAATSYDVAALQNEKSVWEMRNEQLGLQIAELKSLDHVDQVASSRLHMGPPAHVVYVKASSDIVSVPTPTPAPTPESASLSVSSLSRLISGLGFGPRTTIGR